MNRSDWNFSFRRMEAYFQRQHDPLLEEELFGKFEHWSLDEWDEVWMEITDTVSVGSGRMPGYNEFASVRRALLDMKQTRTAHRVYNDEVPFPREGLKRIGQRIIELDEAHSAEYKDEGQAQPLNQVMVRWWINYTQGLTRR